MKLVADVNIAGSTIEALRDRAFDVEVLVELSLHRLKDPDILIRAAQDGRVVVTFDRGFTAPLALGQQGAPSVVVLRLRDQTPDNTTRKLLLALDEHAEDLRRGAIVIVEESTTRVRKLPLKR